MKTAIFLLIFALCFMGYRGDFGHRPEEIGLPSISQITQKAPEPKPREFRDVIREDSTETKSSEFFVLEAKVKPKRLEVFNQEKDPRIAQAIWIESHKVQDEERLVIDKLRNLAAWGKYE